MGPSQIPPPPSGGDAGDRVVVTAEEHAEYRRLRHAADVRHRRARHIGASVLLLITLLLAPLAVVAAWVDSEVSDTDRYVQTVAPLGTDPAVQSAVTDRLTNRVVAEVNVEAVTQWLGEALADAGAPPAVVDRTGALAGPLRAAVTSAVHRVVNRVVTSDTFAQAWDAANRRAHAAVVNVLTGSRSGAVRAEGDKVVLDLGTVVDEVKKRLVDAGFEKASAIPAPDRQITLFESEELSRAQAGMRLLDILGVWLPVLTVVLAALTVWTAPAHRVMLLITAAGIVVMMVVLLVALAVVRRVYLDAVPASTLPPDAAQAIFDTFVRFLRDSTRTLLVVAVITALAAYLYGPGRVARGVRTLSARGTTAAGHGLRRVGLRTGAAGQWLDAHRSWTTGVVVAGGVLALVLWNYPTVGAVALVLGLVLLVLVLLAVLAAAGGPATAAGEPGGARP
ncbi:hypothetical protein [Streptomyces chromofuscus]|uniref:Integral membrane protein n=1 Tax=Streptomyces chromofuscus TaxID=42881 RepID=A0A7M2T8J6_STRCW|nr:hypothetical protein [Streptomyces chromofuscus]QOV45056.1 hypothetical protein IPT68_03430 [Streptomyces chromofuscus]GGT28043.1 hypothetical protein GCM10010254_55860 [Streptomyces chromofuscus]